MGKNSYYKIFRNFIRSLLAHTRTLLRTAFHLKTVNLNGVKVEICPSFPASLKERLYSQRYESTEAKCVLAKLESQDIVLELGAGIGYISSLCARQIGSDRVFCYEANPELIPLIQNTYKMNNVSPTLTNAVLATSQEKVIPFFLEDDVNSSSLIQRSSQARAISVPCLNASEEISRIKPTFLIMDIEGGELELIPGLHFDGVQKIILELHEKLIGVRKSDSLRAYLTKCGFTVDPKISRDQKLFLERIN